MSCMAYTSIVPTEILTRFLNNPDWAILDCRFSLADPEQGHKNYVQSHIPGAVYAHLDEEGLWFEIKNSHREYNYLKTIWKCKKYDLQALFPDCEVAYVTPPGKLGRIEITGWKTPMSDICTAPIQEKKKWAKKIFNKFGKLNTLMDESLWDLKEGKLEAPEEFIQLKEIA